VAAIAAVTLPILLIWHAIAFWGRGIIDDETSTFVVNYLARRPFLATIFDPQLNDWGSFQARELSYVLDLIDARVFSALLIRHVFFIVPISGLVGLIAASLGYVFGARRVLGLGRTTTGLLLALFLSCIVVQASTPVFYRSSKILLSVLLLGFLFVLTGLVGTTGRRINASVRSLGALFLLGLGMSMADRQGFFYLLVATGTIGLLWLKGVWLKTEDANLRSRRWRALVTGVAASVAATLYNHVIAPEAILRLNGYWPDFSYQDVPLSRLDWALVAHALEMCATQMTYFFGNLPILAVCLMVAALWLMESRTARDGASVGKWRDHLTSDGIIAGVCLVAALPVLLGAMIMRHPPVYSLPDHSFFYYTLTFHVVLLFGVSLAASRMGRLRGPAGSTVMSVALLVMIAGNILHYPSQRNLMLHSDYFAQQYRFSQLYASDFEVMEGRVPGGRRSLPTWMQLSDDGVTLDLPIAEESSFLDEAEAARAALENRTPLAGAGPYWVALHGFLVGPASPANYADEIRPLLAALRAIGVRRVVLHRDEYRDRALAAATIDAARSSEGARVSEAESDPVTIDLADAPAPASTAATRLRAIPPAAFHIAASPAADLAPLAVDGNETTEWVTGVRQQGQEWIRVSFDRPRTVARVRLDLTEESRGNYPHRLLVQSVSDAGAKTLYEGSPLAPMMLGILQEPTITPITLDLLPAESEALVIRQTGQADPWNWSVHELTLFEAAQR